LAKTEAGRERVRRFVKAGATGLRVAGKSGGIASKIAKGLDNAAHKMEKTPQENKENPQESPEAAEEGNRGAVAERDRMAQDSDMQDRMKDIADTEDPEERAQKISDLVNSVREEAAEGGADEEGQEDAHAGIAMVMAAAGLIKTTDSLQAAAGTLTDAGKQQLVAAEAARNANMLLAGDVSGRDTEGNLVIDSGRLTELVRNNTVDTQSEEALRNPEMARAIYQGGKNTERQRNAWDDEQNQAVGRGYTAWLNRAGTAQSARANGETQMTDQQYRGATQAAVSSGANIDVVLGANGGRRAINPQLKQQVALNARSYDRQDNNGSVALAKSLSAQQLARLMPRLKSRQKSAIVGAAIRYELGGGRDLVILSNPALNVKQPQPRIDAIQ